MPWVQVPPSLLHPIFRLACPSVTQSHFSVVDAEHAVAQENAPNKPVHLIYLFGGVLAFYLLKWSVDWIWGYFTRSPNELYITVVAATIALLGGIFLYRHDKTFGLISDIAAELKKVTWPTGKEVKSATIVVIVMTVISALILASFDMVWSRLTEIIYG
jgi:preprotein translocase subunit SecE